MSFFFAQKKNLRRVPAIVDGPEVAGNRDALGYTGYFFELMIFVGARLNTGKKMRPYRLGNATA